VKITGPLFFVFNDSAFEKELANLRHTSSFSFCNLHQGNLDLGWHPEADAFIFACHHSGAL